ncbi:BgTH12-02421 [Blumeria graminis f. sp. triticale]|uniref:Bgt-3445 n=3 Tax=Blumeria graminis TaxID=34373 RepID=A0A061HLB5_BLUGR|nr:Mg(2+) transporter [Blumeria graminis f. sp. tritici 96224]CAD6502182.1 BgTH12-02421 [Blumeria graminis f. sp. triticale]VDB86198.1 Bgt-3445 [Blumeria graminis f. sp. tritici]
MSDLENEILGSSFSAPVPELDDHTHQIPSIQRPRSRHDTSETIHSTNQRRIQIHELSRPSHDLSPIIARDLEEALILEDEEGVAPRADKSRRGTITNYDGRAASPPNSVKAFADARRRERELSLPDVSNSRSFIERRLEEYDLHRAASRDSRRSYRSRRSKRYTNENEAPSFIGSSKSAEDDVCFPLHMTGDKDTLHIDFEILENFIADEESRDKTPPIGQPQARVFHDLTHQQQNDAPLVFTAQGDILNVPSLKSFEMSEKESTNSEKAVADTQRHFENRFEFFSSLGESTIHAPEFGDLVLPGEDVRSLFTFPREEDMDGVWWLNMNSPTDEEIRTICKAFGVHPLTIEDIGTQEAREKIELFPSYYFACFRSFHVEKIDGGQQYEPFNIYVVVFREGTLSFSFFPNRHAADVRKRITMLKDYVSLSSDWICYALIDNIVDSFAPVISKIESETDHIEDEVFIARNDDMHTFLRKIGMVRKNVMGLMKLLGGKADVLKGFTKRCNANYKVTPRMDIGLYLGDIQDHVVTMMTNLAHFEKMLSRSHSNYLAQLSIDNITQGNHANNVLSKITLLASILVPLNLVCGMFGMNVKVPWRDTESLSPFFGILGLLFLLTVVSLYAARRLRFI